MYLLHKEIVVDLPEVNIIVPSRKPIAVPETLFTGNEVRGILRDSDENILHDTGWISNTFTDYGSEHLYGNFGYAMSIGTGTGATAPAMTDLETETHRAQCATYSQGNNGGPNYDFWQTKWYRFLAGDGTGLISEVGVHFANAAGTLCCRALLAVPIDKQAANILDMFYRATCTPSLTDGTGSTLIDGINYDYTVRPYDVALYTQAFNGLGPASTASGAAGALHTNVWDPKTTTTSGQMYVTNSVVDAPAKSRSWSTTAYLDNCVFPLPGGIKCCYQRWVFGQYVGTEGGIGVGFVATDGPDIGEGVPKDETEYFTVNWTGSWNNV